MAEPRLEIGVIYTHERHFMPPLLTSMAASCEGRRARLLLVDNASADGAEQWTPLFPEVRVIRNRRRLHYSANLNRVIEHSGSEYLLLLNTDMYFDPPAQCLSRMIDFMDANPRCGLSGCRLLHADGSHAPSARKLQTFSIIAARRLGLAPLMRRTISDYLYADRAPTDTYACDWLSGCFLMFRRAALEQVGLFDEGFVKYFEDVDICHRTALAGWSVLYHGATYCYHLEQRASRRLFSHDARLHLKSYLRWLWKWGGMPRRRAA